MNVDYINLKKKNQFFSYIVPSYDEMLKSSRLTQEENFFY